MKKNQKYDPEDIESLLLNKEFNKLYDEERAFVLKHVSSEPEYNMLRKTLLNVKGTVKDTNDFVPSDHIKSSLLEAVKQNRPSRGFGLNSVSLFFYEIITRPPLRYTAAALAVLVVVLLIVGDHYTSKTKEQVAITVEPPQKNADTNKNLLSQEPLNTVPPQSVPSNVPPIVKKDAAPNDNGSKISPEPLPVVASRSLSQDEALEGFLFEVL